MHSGATRWPSIRLTASAAPQITGAIRQAAQSTGISFEYLLTTAKIESNLNPSAQASTSSAKGLYQFIDQTWLGTMKQDALAEKAEHRCGGIPTARAAAITGVSRAVMASLFMFEAAIQV